MVLQPGTRLGPYEVLGLLGAGGMGEVYKARDTRLDRTVAVKVLSASLAADPIFRERFDREARTISSLDHSNICVLYDVGREPSPGPGAASGIDYLVMQFLDGETLASRLERGPVPIAQALDYASQMAAALDRAHRAGIVHRDLKPGNVMLARAGSGASTTIKLLDFGLAKTPVFRNSSASAAQTMTTPLTGQGTIVGTLQYMAPEQLEGRDVDARTDIFALGSILYEMLTGKRAFEAGSQAGVMAAILEKEPPPISTVQPLSPPGLDRIVQRCLAKDPDARWQSASDLAAALSWVRTDSGAVATPTLPRRSRRSLLAGAAVAAIALVAAALYVGGLVGRRAEPPRVVRALVAPPYPNAIPEISADGTMILWTSQDQGNPPLWVQPLDAAAGRAIPGTEGATFAFWSPDGRQIGFFADQKLKRVAVTGGAPTVICDIGDQSPRGGSWGAGDVIIFSAARIGALSRVSASGGSPQPLTTLDTAAGHTSHRWPMFLPDGHHFLYFATQNVTGSDPNDAIVFASIDGGDSHVVVHASSNTAFADGRLLYVDKRRLLARPFDPVKGTVSGDAAPVLDDVQVGYGITRAFFAASGTLLIADSGPSPARFPTFDWLGPDGAMKPATADSAFDSLPRLAPDGRRLAVSIAERNGRSGIWTIDLVSGARTRITVGDTSRWSPAWSAGATGLFYLGDNGHGGMQLLSKTVAGGSETVVSTALPRTGELDDCSSEYCLITAWRPETGSNYDVLAVRLSDGALIPVAATPADEAFGRLSADGRLMAYTLEQNGEKNVFVRTVPTAGGVWQVSTGGADRPAWSRDGRRLYYLTAKHVVSVDVMTNGGFTAGPPREVVPRAPGGAGDVRVEAVDVLSDGRMFAAMSRGSDPNLPYRLVLNWNR